MGIKLEHHTSNTWHTWWSIAGPKLPEVEMRFNKYAIIGPISADVEKTVLRAPPFLWPTVPGMCVFHSPPTDKVQSLCRLQIDVPEKNEESALRTAHEIANRLVASLTILTGGQYFVELRMFKLAGTRHNHSPWSETAGVVNMEEPKKLSSNEIFAASKLADLLSSDKIAKGALQHLQAAWQLQSTPGSKPLQAPTLLQYVLCVEAVVNGVMPKIRADRTTEISRDRREFAQSFLSTIDKRNKKANAIADAASELRKISLLNTIPSIKLAGEALGVPSDVIEHAMDLYKFRSSNIGHPSGISRVSFKKWLQPTDNLKSLCLADVIARAYLVGYSSKPEH